MKITTTATRLNELMSERNLRQIDILNSARPFCEQFGIKLSKTDLSQYVNGKVEPGQEKLTVLGLALNVSEAWLMGYDVPPDRQIVYSTDELVDLYIRGAKKWATDFRFTEEQRRRISEYLAESMLRLKTVVNSMADAEIVNGKILPNQHLQNAITGVSNWTGNALKYVNNDFSDDPFDESNVRSQYLDAISKLSRRDQIAWLIRIQDYIDENSSD